MNAADIGVFTEETLISQFELFVGVENGLREVNSEAVEGFRKGLRKDTLIVVSDAKDLWNPH